MEGSGDHKTPLMEEIVNLQIYTSDMNEDTNLTLDPFAHFGVKLTENNAHLFQTEGKILMPMRGYRLLQYYTRDGPLKGVCETGELLNIDRYERHGEQERRIVLTSKFPEIYIKTAFYKRIDPNPVQSQTVLHVTDSEPVNKKAKTEIDEIKATKSENRLCLFFGNTHNNHNLHGVRDYDVEAHLQSFDSKKRTRQSSNQLVQITQFTCPNSSRSFDSSHLDLTKVNQISIDQAQSMTKKDAIKCCKWKVRLMKNSPASLFPLEVFEAEDKGVQSIASSVLSVQPLPIDELSNEIENIASENNNCDGNSTSTSSPTLHEIFKNEKYGKTKSKTINDM